MTDGEASSSRFVALRARLEAMPGAEAAPLPRYPGVTLHKIMGKMFAILSTRPVEGVILKCDPYRAQMLRDSYRGVGHRSHLDPRFWIAVDLNADVPADEIEDLAVASYDLVRAGLTRKQQAKLAAL